MNDDTFSVCTCGIHAIRIELFDWGDLAEPDIAVSIWQQGAFSPDWGSRLRHIWHIIKDGQPHTDQVILSQEEASELAQRLQEMIRRLSKQEE